MFDLFQSFDSVISTIIDADVCGPLLLIWTVIRHLRAENIGKMGNRALQLQVFEYLHSQLSMEPFSGRTVLLPKWIAVPFRIFWLNVGIATVNNPLSIVFNYFIGQDIETSQRAYSITFYLLVGHVVQQTMVVCHCTPWYPIPINIISSSTHFLCTLPTHRPHTKCLKYLFSCDFLLFIIQRFDFSSDRQM